MVDPHPARLARAAKAIKNVPISRILTSLRSRAEHFTSPDLLFSSTTGLQPGESVTFAERRFHGSGD
jgi:hypothetical protein